MHRECQILSHDQKLLIGICQNASCLQLSRKACLRCVKEFHQNDQNFQISDIMSNGQLDDILEKFQQNCIQKNEKIQKACQINKFFLLKEFEEFYSYWKVEYNKWHYLEEIFQQFTNNTKLLTIQIYIDDKTNQQNLQQFLNEQDKEGQDLIDEILGKKHNYYHQQQIKTLIYEPLENINNILKKLTQQVKTNMNTYDDILDFMIYQLKIDEMTVSICEKVSYYGSSYYLEQRRNEINKIQGIQIYKYDIYNQKQICRKGLFLMKLGKFEEALKYCNYLNDQFPLNTEAYNLKVLILTKQKNFNKAIESLNQCIKQNPNYGSGYEQKAKILKDQKKIKEAMECLDLCIKLNPSYGSGYEQKAQILKSQYYFDEAIECLDQCIKINPKYGSAYQTKADLLQRQNIMQAIECLDQCIKLNPNYGDAYEQKAQILTIQYNFDQAIECLDQCIKMNPNYEYAYKEKALLLKDQNKINEAIKCLDQCIKLNPNYEDAYQEKAGILEDQKNIKEAIECWDQCIKLNPQHFDVLHFQNIIKIRLIPLLNQFSNNQQI